MNADNFNKVEEESKSLEKEAVSLYIQGLQLKIQGRRKAGNIEAAKAGEQLVAELKAKL
jgi:hypothetical protein